jgi:hypothetical protein
MLISRVLFWKIFGERIRDSKLKRGRYKFPKFIGKTRMERNLEIISKILSNENEWQISRYVVRGSNH